MNSDSDTTSQASTDDGNGGNGNVDSGTAPSGTVNVSSGWVTFTLSGNNYNTVTLKFGFSSEPCGFATLQPPTYNAQGNPGDSNGTFNYNLHLTPPSGQVQGQLTAGNMTVTPTGQQPIYLQNTMLAAWDNQGNILYVYGN